MSPQGAPFITPERALIFRITHVDNIPWLLGNGVQCRSSPKVDPKYVNIGNPELIEKRRTRVVPIPPAGTLSDYVPFYFTPFSPMLYNIKTGYSGIPRRPMNDIAILVTSLHTLTERGISYVFTDRHAYLTMAHFSSSLDDLPRIDWPILQRRDFARDPEDPAKMERYQAEALVHRQLPCDALQGIICASEARKEQVAAQVATAGHSIQVLARPNMFF